MRHANTLLTIFGFLIGLLIARTASGGDLQVGDMVPEFCCVDDQGQVWDSRDYVGQMIVVLYFFPGDFSRCCTRQAEAFRDHYPEFADQCAEVVGVSGDTVQAHRLFKDTYQLKQILLSDSDGHVARTFGVPVRSGEGGKAMVKNAKGVQLIDRKGNAISIPRIVTAERWTFVIDTNGRVIYRDTASAPKTDSQEVLTFLRDPQCVAKSPGDKKDP